MKRRLVWGLIGLGVIMVAAAALYGWYRIELRPVNVGDHASASFVIPPGERVPDIAGRLHAAGLIRDKNVFITYVDFHGLRTELEAGSYSLSPDQSSAEIAGILSHGKVAKDLLVIPEGDTIAQIESLAAEKGLSKADFAAALGDHYSDTYASQRPADVDLEGYLFPDGYQLTPSTSAHTLIQNMLSNFDQKITPSLVQSFADEGLSVHQGLTLASIIEREVANSSDRPIVAQVFLSRLKAGIPLESDVTVQYAADQLGVLFDLNLDSPYNTYFHKGLPIGPISNPGIDSINAAAHPASTSYLYFVAGKDGKTHFATTLAEHQANISKYLQ